MAGIASTSYANSAPVGNRARGISRRHGDGGLYKQLVPASASGGYYQHWPRQTDSPPGLHLSISSLTFSFENQAALKRIRGSILTSLANNSNTSRAYDMNSTLKIRTSQPK